MPALILWWLSVVGVTAVQHWGRESIITQNLKANMASIFVFFVCVNSIGVTCLCARNVIWNYVQIIVKKKPKQ